MINTLKDIKIVLGSQSPRRKELLASMGLHFDVIIRSVDEQVSESIDSALVAEHIAKKKMEAFDGAEFKDSLIITADTVVVDEGNHVLGKPKSRQEAFDVLCSLSAKTHFVFTGVALKYGDQTHSFTQKTIVHFAELDEQEIAYYIDTFEPYDKAGAYGIQEWIGRIAVQGIQGSYENVMGLPTAQLYKEMKRMMA